ncbi:MAG: DUF47 family protein [Woeseia sp.]
MTAYVADIFGPSPLPGIDRHADIVFRCVQELGRFFQSVTDEEWDAARLTRDAIARLECEADDLEWDIGRRSSGRLLMPFARTDLLALVAEQGRMTGSSRKLSGSMVVRKTRIPAAIAGETAKLVDCCVRTAEQARRCVGHLPVLLFVGFRGFQVSRVVSMIDRIDELRNEAGRRQVNLHLALQALEGDSEPVSLAAVRDVVEQTMAIAESAAKVGRRMRNLVCC